MLKSVQILIDINVWHVYAIPMIKKRLAQIESKIKEIKIKLTVIEEMRPGSLTVQYKDPENHSGSYYQLSYTFEMKSRTEYIRKEYVGGIRRQIKNYKQFKRLNSELVALCIERSRL
ncbi:MAG: hypothetical protein GY928_12140 [Colwellia sp.]|nr:hypothetical protein [Colwellia sp.]